MINSPEYLYCFGISLEDKMLTIVQKISQLLFSTKLTFFVLKMYMIYSSNVNDLSFLSERIMINCVMVKFKQNFSERSKSFSLLLSMIIYHSLQKNFYHYVNLFLLKRNVE